MMYNLNDRQLISVKTNVLNWLYNQSNVNLTKLNNL
uniref:Uncharacterized protein n=1 Tax=Anguilla anguilla TaxID=7936 RepID=A0A0E9U7V3_ANGAN